jgi:hypothetical protein
VAAGHRDIGTHGDGDALLASQGDGRGVPVGDGLQLDLYGRRRLALQDLLHDRAVDTRMAPVSASPRPPRR